jgi:Zinc binding domain
MSSCCSGESCEVTKTRASSETACPRCGEVGWVVADETIQAILKPGHADGFVAVARRFCRTQTCAVLYYDTDGKVVEKSAASVRIGLKETEDPIPLCYCFGYTRADVRREVAETGTSTIPDRIQAEIHAGRCACERKNPSGTCCLGDVRRALTEALSPVAPARVQPSRRR